MFEILAQRVKRCKKVSSSDQFILVYQIQNDLENAAWDAMIKTIISQIDDR